MEPTTVHDIYFYGTIWDKFLADCAYIRNSFLEYFESLVKAIKNILKID